MLIGKWQKVALVLSFGFAVSGAAQELQLSIVPSIGIPGLWAQVQPGQEVLVQMSGFSEDAVVVLVASIVEELGVLDKRTQTPVYSAKARAQAEVSFLANIPPQLAGSALSLQAQSFDIFGQAAASYVLTLIVEPYTFGDDGLLPKEDPQDPVVRE